MNRPLSSVSKIFLLLAKIILTPPVFGWMIITHFIPALLRVWNPTPLKVLCIMPGKFEDIASEGRPCVLAYQLIPPPMDLGGSAPDYENYLARAIVPYHFTVNRPELLKKVHPKTLKRIAREFERFGLQAKEVHFVIANSTNIRTVIHPLSVV